MICYVRDFINWHFLKLSAFRVICCLLKKIKISFLSVNSVSKDELLPYYFSSSELSQLISRYLKYSK
jgi:hypothetical protein